MNKKRRISIKIILLIPVFVLGIVAIISNVQAISNIGMVNETAVEIASDHMVNISELSDIQKTTQAVHKLALSHIIATDLDTLIEIVGQVNVQEAVLEGYFEEYRESLQEMDSAAFEQLVANYTDMKYEIENLLAFSGNNEKETAFALANGLIKQYSDGMQNEIDIMVEEGKKQCKCGK